MEIAAALSGIKGALDLAKAAIDARDHAKAAEAIAHMTSLLLEANSSALAMSGEARALSAQLDAVTRELRHLQQRQNERDQYLLDQIARGRFAYRFRGNAEGVPVHYLCQNCSDTGNKSVLRLNPGYDGFVDEWVCANNESHLIRMDR
jgi:hypothetical protein